MNRSFFQKGFTMLELIIVISLMLLLLGGMIAISNNYLFHQQLDNAAGGIVEEIRRAQGDAMAGTWDTGHGIKIIGNAAVRYQGDSYETRNSDYDITSEFPAFLIFSGDTTIQFSRDSSAPVTTATISISNDREEYLITVSSYGNITLTRGSVTP